MSSIAFVGAGPTTLYALNALLDHDVRGASITVFEAQASAGAGTPYRSGWNDAAMLSNIASAEIPPLTQTLAAWLQSRPARELEDMGVDIEQIDDRAFVPRVVLGRYFEAQFATLVQTFRAAGGQIQVMTGCRVIDAVNRPGGMELVLSSSPQGEITKALFDHVVLATGHQWPSRQEVRPGYFTSPWPAATLTKIPATRVGIRGSSLTAIDTAVALAGVHGAFEREGDALTYVPHADTGTFGITMMSRKGLLPEADFYFPLPHPPLEICTEQAIADLIDRPGPGLLDDVFELFRRELQVVDPAYVEATGLADATLEAFGEAYFADRLTADPFEWAAANLEEARATHDAGTTVPWRDAILRMHEVVAAIVPHLDGPAFERFSRHFKPVFVDAYGAVPHESVERMLALHRAGKLDVLALDDDHRIDTHCPAGGARLMQADVDRHFPVFIEATGQRALGAIQFPFLSLLEQGIVRDEMPAVAGGSSRGIVIDDVFQPVADGLPADRLFCLSLPFIMGRHPFVQGITSSHEMGEVVGQRLACALGHGDPEVDMRRAVS
ncbi:FAD/NAD(P)-binding protein [Brevundimonas subvibrioides]|uniref:FAD dependent oxidoreductase n=1 Tax=Brevundimonas subvibrioides (strain ATCC 15264 / DSM 4735 / LMG 14903 / NBRC 16000 / CB 81) TaxID=633149 RepID=D9QK96_BRESC|nr:FAD/NAD(P)-binding protein [Brevundimonas subvibrioides]ADL01681.1 FAD dependent oxidoreductase [Brevundimonas subvibrioides ATCC 15264]